MPPRGTSSPATWPRWERTSATRAPRRPRTVSVIEGGRLVLDHDGDVIEASGEGMSVTVGAADVSLRAPLGAGVHTLSLRCAQSERTVEVSVIALAFSSVASWEPDDRAGLPAGREYFAWWKSPVPNDAAVYLYGGFAYEPTQFTPTSELFRFDLSASTWTSMAQHGDRPLHGGRVATSPSGEVRYFGGASFNERGSLDTPPAFYTWTVDDEGARSPPRPATVRRAAIPARCGTTNDALAGCRSAEPTLSSWGCTARRTASPTLRAGSPWRWRATFLPAAWAFTPCTTTKEIAL